MFYSVNKITATGDLSLVAKLFDLPAELLEELRDSRFPARRLAMKISGHKTRAVFDRYNIVSESDIADAVRKLEAGQFGHRLGTLEEIRAESLPVPAPSALQN